MCRTHRGLYGHTANANLIAFLQLHKQQWNQWVQIVKGTLPYTWLLVCDVAHSHSKEFGHSNDRLHSRAAEEIETELKHPDRAF